jgi:hypothetical protein
MGLKSAKLKNHQVLIIIDHKLKIFKNSGIYKNINFIHWIYRGKTHRIWPFFEKISKISNKIL